MRLLDSQMRKDCPLSFSWGFTCLYCNLLLHDWSSLSQWNVIVTITHEPGSSLALYASYQTTVSGCCISCIQKLVEGGLRMKSVA